MPRTYLDTSAVMKLLFREDESHALKEHLARRGEEPLVASWLLHTELHCAAARRGGASASKLSTVLSFVDLVDLTRGDLITAGSRAPLRAQDAIHLAVAMRLAVDEIVTYDMELADASARAGLRVISPGSAA